MSRPRLVIAALAILLASLPLAFVVTFLLWPLWSWIEQRFGIESIGHGFPANWCFFLTYAVLMMLAGCAFLIRARRV